MKSAGITIFTIGVGVEASRAEVLLKSCASDQAKYLSAMSDGDLEAAFRSIALWLAPLRLTN